MFMLLIMLGTFVQQIAQVVQYLQPIASFYNNNKKH